MRLLKYAQQAFEIDIRHRLTRQQFVHIVKTIKPLDALCIFLPLCALLLWSISLQYVNIGQMNDLGLVSVLPFATIIALIIMMVSFCLALRRPRASVMLLHLVLLIFLLYGVTTLVEQAPRFSVLYRHAGYTEYIMRTGTIDPALDAYFNWPGFFVLATFVTQIAGYQSILGYAVWAPVFLNLLYMGPLYLIFTSATTEKRTLWLGLWFFYLTNWIGQDYFSPQGFNFFLYLVIIVIELRWFTAVPTAQANAGEKRKEHRGRFSLLAHRFFAWLRAPDTLPFRKPIEPRQRIVLLVIMFIIFTLVVFSHPLTPFFVLASVIALAVFRRCTPWWLPILMVAMTGGWIILMTQPFLFGHLNWVTGGFGDLSSTFTANVANRVTGSPGHSLIVKIGLIMTLLIWGLAFAGACRRLLRGYHDLTYMLLAIAPFPLLAAEPYGGEMLLRIYFFSLPPMVFFAASLFYPTPIHRTSRGMTAAVAGASIVLLIGFLFTRYGNERMDYMTYAEVDGVRYLYSMAPQHSTLIEGSDGSPWRFQDYEQYNTFSLTESLPNAVETTNVNAIIQFVKSQVRPNTNVYVFFTRSQKATAEVASGLPPGALDRLENALFASGQFTLLYSNPDAQILIFNG
jgi:hypothetical protein